MSQREIFRAAQKELKPCKECNEEPRLPGSSRGQKCKDAHAIKVLHSHELDDRLGRPHTKL